MHYKIINSPTGWLLNSFWVLLGFFNHLITMNTDSSMHPGTDSNNMHTDNSLATNMTRSDSCARYQSIHLAWVFRTVRELSDFAYCNIKEKSLETVMTETVMTFFTINQFYATTWMTYFFFQLSLRQFNHNISSITNENHVGIWRPLYYKIKIIAILIRY